MYVEKGEGEERIFPEIIKKERKGKGEVFFTIIKKGKKRELRDQLKIIKFPYNLRVARNSLLSQKK